MNNEIEIRYIHCENCGQYYLDDIGIIVFGCIQQYCSNCQTINVGGLYE